MLNNELPRRKWGIELSSAYWRIKLSNTLLFVILIGLNFASYSQSLPVSTIDSLDIRNLNWYNLDAKDDNVEGASVYKAYNELLKDKKPAKTIIVAVIDSGFDFDHPDLEGRVWINEDEIPDNGIDDDNNGYIDDIHGWNFIGNSDGEKIMFETYEEIRLYRKYHPVFKEYSNVKQVPDSLKKDYKIYLECKEFYNSKTAKHKSIRRSMAKFGKSYLTSLKILVKFYGKKKFTKKNIENINPENKDVANAKKFILSCYKNGMNWKKFLHAKKENDIILDKHLNIDFNPRDIIDDNPFDITDINYGNNDIYDLSFHGTFVSAIICANKSNGLGIDGITDDVDIMVLRAISRGDEYDKDVALAIRYAVDNGANIINMSFGKRFSPQKEFVDAALLYAAENNVLVVQGAGNEATDLSKKTYYPTDQLDNGMTLNNYIKVGATSKTADLNFCGSFTNYSQKNVDILAPGVNIISLYPKAKYYMGNGTSFSSPVVSGVAALIWSYFPKLNAREVKDILLESCTLYPKLKVIKPDKNAKKPKKIKFKTLSKTGGVVNAYNALNMASEMYKEKGYVSPF